MRPNLYSYLPAADFDSGEFPHPDWLTQEFANFCSQLAGLNELDAWSKAITSFRENVEYWTRTGRTEGLLSVSTLFVVDCLDVSVATGEWTLARKIFSFVNLLSISEQEWTNILNANADKTGTVQGQKLLRIGQFPEATLDFLWRGRKMNVFCELYRLVYFRIDRIYQRAITSADSFDEWVGDLAVLAAYLRIRFWLPLTYGIASKDDKSVMEFYDGGARLVSTGKKFEVPFLADLFNEEDRKTLHRRGATADEYEAHLFASIACGHVLQDQQDELARDYRMRKKVDPIAARQSLALEKSRLSIAPYVKIT